MEALAKIGQAPAQIKSPTITNPAVELYKPLRGKDALQASAQQAQLLLSNVDETRQLAIDSGGKSHA
jgi:hypothetical protein